MPSEIYRALALASSHAGEKLRGCSRFVWLVSRTNVVASALHRCSRCHFVLRNSLPVKKR